MKKFNSCNCFTKDLQMNIWALQPLTFLNPAHTILSALSIDCFILCRKTQKNTFLGTDNASPVATHINSSPILGSLTMTPFFQESSTKLCYDTLGYLFTFI